MIEKIAITGSTNADLANRLRSGETIPEGFWLRAEQQTGGRGRLGREWVSPAGNLYCSTVIAVREGDPPAHSLSFAVSLAVYDTLRRSLPDETPILLKWPNDVLVRGAKICGILLERYENSIIAGIGINVCHAPEVEGREVTSILTENGEHGGSCDLVLSILADALTLRLARWRREGLAATLRQWAMHSHSVGDPLIISGSDGSRLPGSFVGLAADGALELRLEDGTHRSVYAGDVTLA